MKGKELVKLLIKHGFKLERINGSHHIMHNEQTDVSVSIPCHNKDIKKRTFT
jgi:predicted RNA binding protein YcfA (HicA-like mRNA interferase family)